MSSCDVTPESAAAPPRLLARDDLIELLSAEGAIAGEEIRRRAYEVKLANVGHVVYLRGLVEIGNRCVKNCNYCGLRRELRVPRYTMPLGEILRCIEWIAEAQYGSVVLQAGERTDREFITLVDEVIRKVRRTIGSDLGITLSLGEQTRDTYARWLDAGADRYLLRIETSSERLYRLLHPPDHSFRSRVDALGVLRELGYQVGSGVMIGFPGQTISDLADDLLFLRELDVDMIGMGPYLVHHKTPLGRAVADTQSDRDARLALALRMISVGRILLPDVNIASTTALQALHPAGRELGLLAGANVLMPVVTPVERRRHYVLYDERQCAVETAADCRSCVVARVGAIGESIASGRRGDPVHFALRSDGVLTRAVSS